MSLLCITIVYDEIIASDISQFPILACIMPIPEIIAYDEIIASNISQFPILACIMPIPEIIYINYTQC